MAEKKRGPGRPPGSKNKNTKSSGKTAKSTASTRPKTKQEQIADMQTKRQADNRVVDEIWAITMIAIGIFLIFTIMLDTTGAFGEKVHDICKGIFGWMAYVLPFFFIIHGILLLFKKVQHFNGRTLFFSSLTFVNLCVLYSYRFIDENSLKYGFGDIIRFYKAGVENKMGGAVGMEIGSILVKFFGKPGLILIAITLIIISLLFVLNTPLSKWTTEWNAKREAKRLLRHMEEAEAKKVRETVIANELSGAGISAETISGMTNPAASTQNPYLKERVGRVAASEQMQCREMEAEKLKKKSGIFGFFGRDKKKEDKYGADYLAQAESGRNDAALDDYSRFGIEKPADFTSDARTRDANVAATLSRETRRIKSPYLSSKGGKNNKIDAEKLEANRQNVMKLSKDQGALGKDVADAIYIPDGMGLKDDAPGVDDSYRAKPRPVSYGLGGEPTHSGGYGLNGYDAMFDNFGSDTTGLVPETTSASRRSSTSGYREPQMRNRSEAAVTGSDTLKSTGVGAGSASEAEQVKSAATGLGSSVASVTSAVGAGDTGSSSVDAIGAVSVGAAVGAGVGAMAAHNDVYDESTSVAIENKNASKHNAKQEEINTDSLADEINSGLSVNEETGGYKLPDVELLKKSRSSKQMMTNYQLEQKGELLEKTLRDFGVDATILDVTQGASVTRYEVQPATGVKVSKITGLADDIALNLRAKSIRIEAPIPGKAAVGIEVENDKPSPILIRDLIDSDEFRNAKSKLSFVVGKDISGNNIVADLKTMPHLLIAGATGSGKSVCINSIITSILYKAKPNEVKFIMIDPKVVELGNYNGIPHLLTSVVTDPRKASRALAEAVAEMNKRYEEFAKWGVKDLNSYNELMMANQEPQNKKPEVVILIDELADLMMAAPSQVEEAICRLAQKARAAGMHLIVATQRPSVDVVTGLIKANIPSRIAFSVASQVDSRTIIDMAGAEKLLGKGDMLYSPVDSNKPYRLQGPYISDQETARLIDFIKTQGSAEYSEELSNAIEGKEDPKNASMEDELTEDAIAFILKSKQASVSMLQRRFRIGYNRAARIIDEIEAMGIIGPQDGSRGRKVLITEDEYYGVFDDQEDEKESVDEGVTESAERVGYDISEDSSYIDDIDNCESDSAEMGEY